MQENALTLWQLSKQKKEKKKMTRKISKIAKEIAKDWRNIRYTAEPYLQIMFIIDEINDIYGSINGKNIILRFLCNAATWRGETARRIKKELKEMVK
jgi:ATP-dependent protease HslVU (ClpYQ) peptidase subunit